VKRALLSQQGMGRSLRQLEYWLRRWELNIATAIAWLASAHTLFGASVAVDHVKAGVQGGRQGTRHFRSLPFSPADTFVAGNPAGTMLAWYVGAHCRMNGFALHPSRFGNLTSAERPQCLSSKIIGQSHLVRELAGSVIAYSTAASSEWTKISS